MEGARGNHRAHGQVGGVQTVQRECRQAAGGAGHVRGGQASRGHIEEGTGKLWGAFMYMVLREKLMGKPSYYPEKVC